MRTTTALLAAALAVSATAHAQPRKLTLSGAIELTLHASSDLAIAKEARDAARDRVGGAKAHRLPALEVQAIGNLYTEPYQLDFGGSLFTLHEQTTSVSNVRIVQPLTGLAYLSELVGAANHDAAVASADYDRARLDAAYKTADAYLRLLEARAGATVAHRSVVDITAELGRAHTLRDADTLTNVDVLRLESAKAAADQAAVRADTAAAKAAAALVVTIGLHDGEAIDVVDDLPKAPPALAMSVDQAIARALQVRPELRGARERIAASNNLITSKRERYLPNINAIAAWQHTTGVQPFQPKNEEYVGLQVQWTVWDWGAVRHDVSEARHQHARAKLAADALGDHVRLEVRSRWLDAKAGFDSLASAQKQLDAAEEAYRLQHVKYENAVATTTDVLDAETEVAKARLRSAVARYDYYLALVALARAVGDVPRI